MLQNIRNSFLLAWSNIWSNLFHTFLSVLGVVIGVAALVSMLSLIDGMERFARDQIAQTTNLNAIIIRSQPFKTVDNVRIRKDSVKTIDYLELIKLQRILTKPTKAFMRVSKSALVSVGATRQVIGVNATATGQETEPGAIAEVGKLFTETDIADRAPKAIVNEAFLKAAKIGKPEEALNQSILLNNIELKIIGVLAEQNNKTQQVYFPITLLSAAELSGNTPETVLEVLHTEEIPALKEEISSWLESKYPRANQDFEIVTNESRVEQAVRGFLLFRVIMGLIVGISVIVGGIGVMNVLLISVTERTVEIGIRKAVGANRRDIVLLFLAESITVSGFGSFVGVVFGVLGTMVIIPIVKAITKVPFQAAYTLNTFLIISIVALIVGVTFGTYPALRASRLNPVEAVRHE